MGGVYSISRVLSVVVVIVRGERFLCLLRRRIVTFVMFSPSIFDVDATRQWLFSRHRADAIFPLLAWRQD